MNEEPHSQTLRVIRRITADSVLEIAEVLDLARFLNDHREARHSWPGAVLWKTLESVLEDGEISEEELVALGKMLEDIEAECVEVETPEDGSNPGAVTPRAQAAVGSVDAIGFTIPESVSGSSMQTERGRLHAGNLAGPSCDCEEWVNQRAKLPERHPGRICRHVANALRERLQVTRGDGWSPAFRGMVEEVADLFRGTVPDAEWRELRVNERDYLLALAGDDWAHVYGPNAAGAYERFSYRRKTRRWFFGASPLNAPLIAAFVDSLDLED